MILSQSPSCGRPSMPAGQGFGPADEILLSNLAEHVSVAVHNAEFYRAAIVTSERANVTWNDVAVLGCSENYGRKRPEIKKSP